MVTKSVVWLYMGVNKVKNTKTQNHEKSIVHSSNHIMYIFSN
jgi:hypothetical protein